jgi:esterase/lipase
VQTNEVSRRALLGSLGAGATALLLGARSLSSASGAMPGSEGAPLPQPAGADALGNGTFQLFAQTDLNFQTLFALGEAGQIAEVGEVVSVVAQANSAPGGATYQVLFDAFIAMANRLEGSARAAQKAGHKVTARSQFLRSAKYYAQALYWVVGTSTPGAEAELYNAMNDVFVAGMQLMRSRPEQMEIPYAGRSLPGWFMQSSAGSQRRPTIIMNNGSDGQNVDMLAQGGFAALERGYNVLIFEGPGQGSQLFLHNIPFRPDWEKVITPVVDYLETRPDVQTDQIAIRGISFGGELAPRAAAFEHRLGAVIADPGSVAPWNNYPSVIQTVASAGTPAQVNAEWNGLIVPGSTPEQKFDLMKSLEIYSQDAHEASMRGEVVSDFAALSKQIQSYNITGVLKKIKSPTLVTQYEGDTFFTTQGKQLYDALKTRKKKFVEFTSVNGAQYHCGPMAPQSVNETCWDWLDTVFGR